MKSRDDYVYYNYYQSSTRRKILRYDRSLSIFIAVCIFITSNTIHFAISSFFSLSFCLSFHFKLCESRTNSFMSTAIFAGVKNEIETRMCVRNAHRHKIASQTHRRLHKMVGKCPCTLSSLPFVSFCVLKFTLTVTIIIKMKNKK